MERCHDMSTTQTVLPRCTSCLPTHPAHLVPVGELLGVVEPSPDDALPDAVHPVIVPPPQESSHELADLLHIVGVASEEAKDLPV